MDNFVVAKVPVASEFAGANDNTGKLFGDQTSRTPPSSGASLPMGLSQKVDISGVTPDSLGMGRPDDTGKPNGPAKGPVNNDGASASLTWG